ncbi:MAG: hypothetical protein JXR40_06880 [Pontiellaceae bacterium]|nr:hypothetical protein [Pontiellaceae bacterium]
MEFGFMKDLPRTVVDENLDATEGLSPMLKELERVVGLEATLALVERWGGINLYIPQTAPEGHVLALAIGVEAAEKLARYFGGDHISMPKAEEYKRLKRDREIWQKRQQGACANTLALDYGLTQRHIWQILSSERKRRKKANRK